MDTVTSMDNGDTQAPTWQGFEQKRRKGSKDEGNNLQSMSQCDEWDKKDDYCSVPILPLNC